MDATEAKVARLQKLLPKMSPEVRAKAQDFLASHGVEQRTGLIGSGRGDQVEGLPPAGPEKPAFEDMVPSNAKIPEHPSALGMYTEDVIPKMLTGGLGVIQGASAGLAKPIAHALASGEALSSMGSVDTPEANAAREAALNGETNPSDKASAAINQVEEEHPYMSATGTLASLGIGGLPALFERKSAQILEAIGARRAEKAAEIAAEMTPEAKKAARILASAKPAAETSLLKQGAKGFARGAMTGAATSAANSLGNVAESEMQGQGAGTDLASEMEKGIVSMLLTGGVSAVTSAMGAIPRAVRDNRTNLGSGGLAQKVERLERRGGKVGPGGVTPPESLDPLYTEAMVGGQPIPEAYGAAKAAEGPYQPGAVGELFRNRQPPAVTRPGLAVQDIAAEKALGPVQAGISATKTDYLRRIQNAQDRFLGSSAQYQQVEPVEVADVLKKYIKARTFESGAAVPYANSGEPMTELNKLFVMGEPVSSAESANVLKRNPSAIRMPVQQANRLGLVVKGADEAAHDAWVVAEPRKVNPEQFESAMQGINKAAAESKTPDALHADLQHAGFKVRQRFEWPADAGPKPGNFQIGNREKGLDTVSGWAAIQARAHELMSETETKLYRIGTTAGDALGETRGADAIRNSLRSMGEPGRNLADDSLWGFAQSQPGGRRALMDMETVNAIEGPTGLRQRSNISLSTSRPTGHNVTAAALRLDPIFQAAGRAPTTAGAMAPGAEALQPYLQQLLQGISARMGR